MKMSTQTVMGSKILAAILILALTITIFPLAGLVDQVRAKAGNSTGDVIINYPFDPLVIDNMENVHWTDSMVHSGYDKRAYTEERSAQWNGIATEDHAVISGNNISFYGYDVEQRMDYVFTDQYSVVERINFTMAPKQMIFHTFYQSGFLFNGKMEDGKYTGYALILECSNTEGMLETGTASLKLYYINDEPWKTEYFSPGNVTNTRTLIGTLAEGIQNRTTPVFRISLEMDPGTGAFRLYLDGKLRINVPVSQLRSNEEGIGFFTGFYYHDCQILSVIRYENVSIEGTSGTLPTQTATVKFMTEQGNNEIRPPETEEGVAGQGYRIVQPKTIIYQGETYILDYNSKKESIKRDIELIYKRNNEQNQITLYYVKQTVDQGDGPRKEASVNGGDWEIGEEEPITVAREDLITYRITADAVPKHQGSVAMLTTGNFSFFSNATWLRQTSTAPQVAKSMVKRGTIVDLPESYSTVSDFTTANNNQWKGKAIQKAWEATENTTVNPYRNDKRVYAWVTNSDTGSGYDLFIGGEGGVWMSASTSNSYLFTFFNGLISLDLEHLHTEKANRMSYMFHNCENLEEVDVSGFDTSNVTDMSYMFYLCYSLKELDVSGFDTSKVTNMDSMFDECELLTELDVSSFDTSKVVWMDSMFQYCSSLTELDVRGFDTSKVNGMSMMFSDCTSLKEIDVSSFDTSKVENVAYMFDGCSSLKELDVTTFDTSNVGAMDRMFQYCSSLKELDLSSFDTSDVSTMAGMFDGCSSLTELNLTTFGTSPTKYLRNMFNGCSKLQSIDLRYFNPPTADMTNMFQNCSSLEELHIESVDFTAATSFNNMFNNTKSNADIYVGTTDMETWLTGKMPSGATVFVQGPGGTQPTPSPGPLSPLPFRQIVVTDTIPDGLVIDEKSITGCSSYQIKGQTIKFYAPSMPLEVSVSAVVAPGTAGKLYDNVASIKSLGVRLRDTNATHHSLGTELPITQQYYVFDGEDNDQKLAVDNLFNDLKPYMVVPGKDFDFDIGHVPAKLYGHYYYGYQYIKDTSDDPDQNQGKIHKGLPPETLFTDVQSPKTIRYYYSDEPDILSVTVHFVDKNGAQLLDPISKTVVKGGEYYLPESYLDSFEKSSKVWNFYDSKLTAPGTGSHLSLGEEADRSILENAPQFANVQANQDITLYFTDDPLVTVHFVEYLNELLMLKSSQTKFVTYNGTFTPAKSLQNPITWLGREYQYAERWFTEPGTILNGKPTPINNITENQEITLCFSTFYAITEKFHDEDGGKVDKDNVIETIPGGFPYTGKPPMTIAGSNNEDWHYVGYRVGDDDSTLNYNYPPDPSIKKVNDDFTFTYVYEKRANDDPSATKDARISEDNGATWEPPNRGTDNTPEAVKVGDVIEYTITVKDPKANGTPFPIGSPVDFPFTDGIQKYPIPHDGLFLLEAWGAQGGNTATNQGGLGGYSAGITTLAKGKIMDIYVGGQNGYNGGGTGINGGVKGGGGTDIRPENGNLASRLLVAGGGGGAGGGTGASAGNGGAGGGTSGAAGSGNGGGAGGTQSAGGNNGQTFGGSSGQGGNAAAGSVRVYGGGGGGYYGGGAGNGTGGQNTQGGGGGGGSAYLSNGLINTKIIAGNLATATIPNPSGGYIIGKSINGFARITPYSMPIPVKSITDTLPAGLKYLSSNPQAKVGTVGDREVLTWDLDGVNFAGIVTIKAEVKESAKTYRNAASVEIKNKTILTNPTYHRSGLRMTEQYREKSDIQHVLINDTQTSVSENANFTGNYPNLIVKNEQSIKKEYRYWGYQIDGGTPIAGVFPGITADDQYTITYLYEKESGIVPSGIVMVSSGLLVLFILFTTFGLGYPYIRKRMQK